MRRCCLLLTAVTIGCGGEPEPDRVVAVSIDTSGVAAQVDERFLSVAVDTSQVVGSFFWDPEGTPGVVGQEDIDPYEFSRPRLRAMAAALAPSMLRIGGTDADKVYYDLSDGPADPPPAPYEFTFTREQVDGVFEFARALDYEVMFTLNAGPGPRDADEVWTPDNARELIEYTVAQGHDVALWELGNELNAYPLIHGITIDGEEFTADTVAARALLDEVAPGAQLAAPSTAFWPEVGEIRDILEEYLAAGGGAPLDVVSWHYYPQQSLRCPLATRRAEPGLMLKPENLDEIDEWMGFVHAMRDEHAPQAAVWFGETGGAQCGGEPGISDAFEGGFWWLDELGRVARTGQPRIVRQTLSGSNYGLINDVTLAPNPDYFNSLLWRSLMGTDVLDVAPIDDPMIRAYAHCARGGPAGAVAVVALNLDEEARVEVAFDGVAAGDVDRYAITANSLDAQQILLNGDALAVAEDGTPPALEPDTAGGSRSIVLEPLSYGFAVLRDADAPACR